MKTQYSGSQLLASLVALIATDGPFDAAKIALVTNVTDLSPTTQYADLDIAGYTGYAASSAVVWQTPHIDDDGRAVVQCLPKEFKPSGSAASALVTHVVLVNGAGNAILGYYKLDTPINFANTMDVYMLGFPVVVEQPAGDSPDILP